MSETPVDPETIEQTRREIHTLAREIAELSKRDLPPEEYFRQFLDRVISAMAAVGGAVWTRNDAGGLQLLYQVNFRNTEIADGGEDQARHNRLLLQTLAKGEAIVVPPYSGGGADEQVGNPTRFLLLLVPLVSEGTVEGLIEIFQRPGAASDVQRGYVKFTSQMCELAAGWLRARRLRQITEQHRLWQQIDQFSQAIHESLDRRETAYAIANEAQRILGCDRVSVATQKGNSYRLEAISGQDTFDQRSNVVTLLEELVRRVLASGDRLHYAGSTADLPPQIVKALEAYVDHAHSKSVLIVPLRRPRASDAADSASRSGAEDRPGEIVGALVCEQIDDSTPSPVLAARVELLTTHAARALANCQDYNNLFLMPLWRTLGKSRWLVTGRRLPKTISVGAALLLVSLAAMLVKIDFAPEGKGELQPQEQRDVFAGIAGVVTDVHVDHGDQVAAGDVLVTLRNTDLAVQLENIAGQRQSTLERLLDAQRRLLDNAPISAEERTRLAGELLQLRKQSESLDTQYELLRAKQKELVIRSPIAGQVITWDTKKLLSSRPVAPGQVLLTVANPQGPWELVVHMPEDNLGYIHAAMKKRGPDLRASYVLATDPGRKLQGTVKEVQQLAELHPTEGQSVKVIVDIDEAELVDPRPGASATAQVHCGRESIAFVWLHDLMEFLYTKVFF